MASLNLNKDVRLMAMGIKVSRATATLPQSATGNIFTITSGRIIVFALIGEVTTALGATATTLKVSSLPTVGSSLDLCTALTVTSFAAGVHFSLPSAAASALVSDTGTGAGVQDIATSPWVLPAGAITITTSASDTGSVKWDVVYVPLDDGAQVAAA